MNVPWLGVLFLITTCVSSSLADATCKSSCKGPGGPFLAGNVYKYQLEGSTVVHLPGSANEVAKLGISATAEVFAESNCQNVLKLTNVEVKSSDGKAYNDLNTDCAKPVKFTYNGGKLQELCGEADDRGVGLNIKRAVVSLLSSASTKDGGTDHGYENDVFGVCPTDYSFSKEGPKLIIHKTKNLNRCAHREQFNFPFPTTAYQAAQSSFGSFETSPLLGAQLTVDQELNNGVLHKATGEEVYNYRPLINPQSGASVKVSYTLTLQGSSAGSLPANVNSPKSLYYEPVHDADGIKNAAVITEALQKATAALHPVATPEAAEKFANLVYVIEQGSKQDILQAFTKSQRTIEKNLFLDGLLYAGSADSVEVAAELLSTEKIPEQMSIRWYLDLNFVKHVSRGSLKSLLPLLSKEKFPHQAYLGIGAVAGKFCLEHPGLCDCPEYQALVSKLAEPLAGGCKVDSHDKENKIIASLKGLRNTRHLTDEVAQKISECAADKSAKTRVRVAAIEAFHADAGKDIVQQTASSVLKDVEEDSELRIKAYLALVESPNPKVADLVKDLVDNEPINQVGSFIVSHLRNLRASVSPEKVAAKQFLGNIINKKKFPIDQRKFSRNYEVSYSFDAVNVGAVGEMNRIFSQKSFIPRSVSLNLTTQLFGHSLNFAQIDLRAENLEYHLEKYFGPKGLFKTKGTKIVDDTVQTVEEKLKAYKDEAQRPKRSVSKQEADAATSKIELGPDYEDRHTDLDLSIKLFGSDIAWINYHHDKLNYKHLKDVLHDKFDESLEHSKNIDIDYKKARQFFDAGVTYPTGLGFGLKVKLNGNSAVNIKVNGKADIKAIVNNPQNAHLAFQVIPSGSIQLTSLLSVDADVVETGVRVSANLHSSTGSDLTVKVLDGYGVDVKLGLPVKKQEILNFNSDVVSVIREKKGIEHHNPIKFNVKRQEHGGCFDQLVDVTGLIVCGEVSLPMEGYKMLSPAYGPSKASLRLEQDDESLTAYHFKTFYNNKNPDQVSFEVLLDTPNSKTNRKFSLLAQGSLKPQKQMLITLVSPFKQASLEGLVIDNEHEQAISAKLVSDGSEYSFKAGARVSGDANKKKYEPLLEYKYPEAAKSDRAWIGRKGATKGGRQTTGIGVTGSVFVEKTPNSDYRKYEFKSVTVTTPKVKVTVDGTITVDTNSLATDLKATYDKDSLILNSQFKKLQEHKYIAKIDFVPSQYPDLGGSVKWEYERAPDKVENKLVIVHGPDLQNEQSRLSITQLLKYKYESAKAFDFHTENTVTYPLLGLSGTLKGSASPKSLHYDVDITYDKNQLKSRLNAKTGGKHPTDYSVDFTAKALGNSVDFSSKHERVTPTKSKFTNSLELKPGGKYQLNGLSELSVKPGDFYQSLDAELTLPQEPKVVKLKTKAKLNDKETEAEFELTAGGKHIVDFELELEKKAEPCGKYKLSLPKYVESHGSFETKGEALEGSFHVDLVKTGRKIAGNGAVTKTPTHLKGSGEVLWDAGKDPSKKVHVETDTELTGKAIDSKNTFQILDYKTGVNVKGSLDGSLADGTLVGDAELILPTGDILVGKVNRVVHLGSDDNKIEGTWEVHHYASKGAQPRKLVLKVAAKNINPAKVQFDGQVDLSYVTPENKDVVLHFVGKKIPQGDKWVFSGQGSVTGSLVPRPLQAKLSGELSDQLTKGQLTADKKFPPGHYDLELSAGNDIALFSKGKVNQGQLSNEFELKLPADMPVTSFKWTTANEVELLVKQGEFEKIVTNNAIYWNGDKFVKFSAENYEKDDEAHGKVSWESHLLSARELSYKLSVDEDAQKGEVNVALKWEGKTADLAVKIDAGSMPIHLNLITNVPDHGKFELDLLHSETDHGLTGDTTLTIVGNDKKLVYSTKYSRKESAPYVDVNLELPQGKSRVYAKLEKKSENHVLVESQIVWFAQGGGSLDLNGEVNAKSLDDFYLKLYVDSPKLNVNKVELEAANKPTKSSAKSFSIHGKSGDKELSGSFNLVPKGEWPNIHYEGNGAVKVGETTYPIKFKLNSEYDLEKQAQTDIELDIGAEKYSSHFLLLNDKPNHLVQVDFWSKFCKDGKCKSDEIKLKSHKKDAYNYESSTDIKLDLSTHVYLEHPFILKNHYVQEKLYYDNQVEVTYGEDKVQYHGYVKEDRAGAELTLPKRVIAAEVNYKLPKDKKQFVFLVEGTLWLDKKNSPNDKTSLLLSSEATQLPEGLSYTSAVRFNTPGLKELSVKSDFNINLKDVAINGKLEADVFAKKNQKLVVEYKGVSKQDRSGTSSNEQLHIHSKGLNIDAHVERKVVLGKTGVVYSVTGHYIDSKQAKREAIAKLEISPQTFITILKVPEGTFISAEFTTNHRDKKTFLKGKVDILGLQFEEQRELSEKHWKMTSVQVKDNSPQLDLEFGYDPGQVAEVSGKFNKKQFLSIEVALDDTHFLKTKHSYNSDVAKDLVKQIKENVLSASKEASRIVKESGNKLAHEVTDKTDDCRKALPNFKPAAQYYQKELQQIKEEITSNKNVKDLIDFLKNTFGTVFAQITAIVHEIATTTEHLLSILNEAVEKVIASVKATIPKLKESYEKASQVVLELVDQVLKHATTLVNGVLDKIKAHEKEIQEIVNIATDFLHEVGQVITVTVGEIQREAVTFVNVLWEQIRALPAYNMLKEKLEELKNAKIPDQYWDGYHEVVATVEQILPTQELRELLKSASEILEKVLKKEPINTQQSLQKLYGELVAAVRSLIALIEAHTPEDKGGIPSGVFFPIPAVSMFAAPPGTFRLSLLNWLRSPDLPSLSEIYHTYRPQHSPLDIIPPFSASAQLIGGTEFFTFDKKHYSFKGSCSYILSKDVVDGNFTVVANMEAGKLKSITVFDHENSIELLHDDSVLVNGNKADLPAHIGDLNMWRKFDSGTGFATWSGFMFFCTPQLKSCAFSINGFYFGKTRGLLGTYNNEPYDDATVPAGKVAKSLAEYANSWKVSPQCSDGTVHQEPAPPAEECSRLFAGDSNLRSCFAYENPERFREACNIQVAQASAESKQDKACNVALSYVGFCYYVHFVKVNLPDHCGKCQVGSQSLHIGESTPVKTPQKQADVVIVIEQVEENEELFKNLVTPLISTLTNDMKEKGITDVDFALIGYGAPGQEWPSTYTFNGKYNEFSGTAKNIYFAKHSEEEGQGNLFSDKLERLKHRIQIETGTYKAAMAFKEAFNYPFRPEAVKTIIGIVASDCEQAILPFQPLRLILSRVNLLRSGIILNLVAPIKDLKIEGKDEKTAANIVGFDSYSVYSQGEAKRKVLKGDEEAFSNLKYSNNLCLDMAVGARGAVFSSTNFIKGKPGLRKNFLQVLSNKITDSLTSVEFKKDCKCELERGMLVKTRCKITSWKEKEALVKGGVKGGVKG